MTQNCWLLRPYPHNKNRFVEFIENDIIAIGWVGIGDLTHADLNEIQKRLAAKYGDSEEQANPHKHSAATISKFKDKVAIGDLVMVAPKQADGNFVAIGQVISDYIYSSTEDDYKIAYPHQRKVVWLEKKCLKNSLPKEILEKLKFRRTLDALPETSALALYEFLQVAGKQDEIKSASEIQAIPAEDDAIVSGFTLTIKNYRALSHAAFSASGVCLIVGPNGSGKTTLLKSLSLLKDAYQQGFSFALNKNGGPEGFQNFTLQKTPTLFDLRIGEVRWELSPEVTADGVKHPLTERIQLQDQYIVKVLPGSAAFTYQYIDNSVTREHVALKKIVNSDTCPKSLHTFTHVLSRYQHYHDYQLETLRYQGSQMQNDTALSPTGLNAFDVLKAWQAERDYRERYEFIVECLQETFPFFGEIGFAIAGQTVAIKVYNTDGFHIPLLHLSNGFLAFLLHLTALCSAPDNGLLAIDEPENGLHPYAIRQLLVAGRDWCATKNITLLLTTHAPFMLNEFNQCPENVLVMGGKEKEQISCLDKLHDPEWLGYFSLGDLYGREFAVQET